MEVGGVGSDSWKLVRVEDSSGLTLAARCPIRTGVRARRPTRSPPHKAEGRLKRGAPKSPVLCREQTWGCQGEGAGEGSVGNLGLAEANYYIQDG